VSSQDVERPLRVDSEPLGGGPLALGLQAGTLDPIWVVPRPRTVAAWRERAAAVRARRTGDWLAPLADALVPTERLRRAAATGVVVTTGQQPGLFGGPLYTLYKALSALALADALESALGVPVAPVFWAATDDGDLMEASATAVAREGGLERFTVMPTGVTLADAVLGPAVSDAALRYVTAVGSAPHQDVVRAVVDRYAPTATAGGAYVSLLRMLLGPLGVSVLDASHADVRAAEAPLLHAALDRATGIATALSARSAAITAAGFAPQVADMPTLSLVFAQDGARRQRVPVAAARSTGAADGRSPGALSPNVLLRPIVESVILPTVAYVGGSAELAYFAQVSAVADALGRPAPLAVPRWSGRIIEPRIAALLARRGVAPDDFLEPRAAERRAARDALPTAVGDSLAAMLEAVDRAMAAMRDDAARLGVPVAALETTRASIGRRAMRLERRFATAVLRRDATLATDFATLAAALRPDGVRQERVLNGAALVARYGPLLIDAVLARARPHARSLIDDVAAT